jgi:hypothetical protein
MFLLNPSFIATTTSLRKSFTVLCWYSDAAVTDNSADTTAHLSMDGEAFPSMASDKQAATETIRGSIRGFSRITSWGTIPSSTHQEDELFGPVL